MLKDGSKRSCGCLKKGNTVGKAIDISGQRFGRLVARRPTEERKNGLVVWECQCDCGETAYVLSINLVRGSTKSCGCLYKERAEQNSIKILTGQRFGKLVALRPTEERKGGYIVWECKCDCGETAYVMSTNLVKGNTKSCGCLHKENVGRHNLKDLTGQRFGRLVALRPTEERKNGFVMWECLCDCGKTVFVRSSKLISENTKSCGCLREPGLQNARTKDLTGQRFGKLFVLRPSEERKNGKRVWECLCDCGKTVFVRGSDLTSGHAKSCGCSRAMRSK